MRVLWPQLPVLRACEARSEIQATSGALWGEGRIQGEPTSDKVAEKTQQSGGGEQGLRGTAGHLQSDPCAGKGWRRNSQHDLNCVTWCRRGDS